MSNWAATRTGTDDWGREHAFAIAGEYKEDILRSEDGLLWLVAGGSNDTLTVWHEMEPPGESIHDYICSLFVPGRTLLDVGAHEGHYSIRAAAAGMPVIAVEANPECAHHLIMNARLNHVEDRITVLSLAAWVTLGMTELWLPPEAKLRNGSGTFLPRDGWSTTGLHVPTVPLDDIPLISEADLGLVKLDVEGSDLHVLEGMHDTLSAADNCKIVWEDHHWAGVYTDQDGEAARYRLSVHGGWKWQTAWQAGVR